MDFLRIKDLLNFVRSWGFVLGFLFVLAYYYAQTIPQ
jgi:hypothetical protein